MFAALPPRALSIKIGNASEHARYNMPEQSEVVPLLELLARDRGSFDPAGVKHAIRTTWNNLKKNWWPAAEPRNMDNNLNYGVVGNCRTAALVSARGTIEWMCLPDFDSPSVFASLLDRRKGGCFGFDVAEEYRISQAYIPPHEHPRHDLLGRRGRVRHTRFHALLPFAQGRTLHASRTLPLRPVGRGRPRLRVHYAPAPDYARGRTEQTVTPEFIESHSLSDPKNRLYLYASLPLGKIARREEIVLERDEFFLLSHNEKVIPVDIEREKLEYCRTLVYWLNWTNRTKRFTYYNDVIERSLLTLKLMSYYNGAVLAALTTSLPESAGDVRNWDYRFCWLRDASMSIETLFRIRTPRAAARFMRFIQSTFVNTHEPYQIMYGIRGERH